MKAFHFTKNGKLRGGQPLPAIGKELRHEGEVVICASGLHASRNVIHALRYAPGLELHVVDVKDIVNEQYDKLVCRSRTIGRTEHLDLKQIVRFALECACLKFWLCARYSPELIEALLLSDSGNYAAANAAANAAYADAYAAANAAAYAATNAAYAAAYAADAADAADAAAYAAANAAYADANAAYADAAYAAVIDCLEQRARVLFGVA